MTILVGYSPDESGTAALHLAAMLARSAPQRVVVARVVQVPWPPNPERIDAEYRRLLVAGADNELVQATARLPADIEVEQIAHESRSVPTGLLELAQEYGADMIVLGSSSGGAFGHVSLGSVTDRILHSSPTPVALAPRGFRGAAEGRVARITASVGGSGMTAELVLATAAMASRIGASLRIASFAVSPATAFGGSIEAGAESLVVEEWIRTALAGMREELAQAQTLPGMPDDAETVVGHGFSWREALEDVPWSTGDVLAVGSSITGPAARVFLGSRASKILRHAPVPVVLVPRAALQDVGADREADEVQVSTR